MTDTPVRFNLIGGSELVRELITNVMTQTGIEPVLDGVASESDIAMVISELSDPLLISNEGIPKRCVVVADVNPDDDTIAELVLDGAEAVISLQSSAQELAETLRIVASGGSVIAPGPARRLMEMARSNRSVLSGEGISLTNREVEILISVGRGESVKETADSLGIAPKTVENLQSRLFRKLDVRNRAQAFAKAHALGLLSTIDLEA